MKKLYAVALYAVRSEIEGNHTILNVYVESDSVFGVEEEVRRTGNALILSKCQPSEGWTDHRVFLTGIPYEDIALAYQECLQ